MCNVAVMNLNHTDIIKLWPNLDEFAADLGVKKRTALGWRSRNSIPWKYWPSLLAKAQVRRVYVTPDHLMAQVAQRRAA
jgi:hypothetical protein